MGVNVSCILARLKNLIFIPKDLCMLSAVNSESLFSHLFLLCADRLVECGVLKRAIEIVYAATLPKASKPFIYLSIKLPPEHIDVNVHPTKREVRIKIAHMRMWIAATRKAMLIYWSFIALMMYHTQVSLLNQEVIIEKIQSVIESKLRNSNESRTFQEQVFRQT